MNGGDASASVAALGDVAGRSVVLTYGSLAAEYDALRSHAVVVDRSHRHRLRLDGDGAAETMTGLVTNDVSALEPGQGCYAAALTSKGRIVADVRIFREADGLLVDAPARAAEGWMTMIRKYVNPRVAPYADVSEPVRDLGVFGPRARHVVADMTGVNAAAIGVLPPYAFAAVQLDASPAHRVLVARVPDLGVEGFELFAPGDLFEELWARALAAKATPMGLEAWEIARIEAGRPEWGLDIDETTIPQEANLDELHAVSYTKGCYIGQEVVARVHFRGHVNRHLRGLRAAGSQPPPRGAALLDAEGKVVGDVRSAASSPRLGGIAVGMVRREIEPGSALLARWSDGGSTHDLRVDIAALPFPI